MLPITLMIQGEFPEDVVKETTFEFGTDSVKDFLVEHGIEPNHHLIFDELICTKYCKEFIDSILMMKDHVASLWIAMGSEPVTGRFSTTPFEEASFVVPKLKFALRAPLLVKGMLLHLAFTIFNFGLLL